MKKLLGVFVAFIILMVSAVLFQVTKLIVEASKFGENMYYSYGKIGAFFTAVIELLPLIIGIWLVRVSWRKITQTKSIEISSKNSD